MSDRVITFSIKPEDLQGKENIQELRDRSARTGISFSYLVLEAIQKGKEVKE